MIVAALLIALLQDGPIRTAPGTPLADPGPGCAVDGRPISAPGCPSPAAAPAEGRYNRLRAAVNEERQARANADARQGEERVGRPGLPTDGAVPAWALDDAAGWEANQCGAPAAEACLRQARNQLAMARAGLATEPPAQGGASGDGENCRTVMRRSESGFGGSLSRVCGDETAVQDLLGRLDVPAQPRPEPCDQPAALETQDAWIARCRALSAR